MKRRCSIVDCDRAHHALGLCARHYDTHRYRHRDSRPAPRALPGVSIRELLADLDGRLTYRMIDHWIRTGAVALTYDARGSGSSRRVLPAEVAAIRDLVDVYERTGAELARMRSGALFAELLAYHQGGADDRSLRIVG